MGSNMDKIYIVMNYVEHDLKSLMETMKQPFLPGGDNRRDLKFPHTSSQLRMRGSRAIHPHISLHPEDWGAGWGGGLTATGTLPPPARALDLGESCVHGVPIAHGGRPPADREMGP